MVDSSNAIYGIQVIMYSKSNYAMIFIQKKMDPL